MGRFSAPLVVLLAGACSGSGTSSSGGAFQDGGLLSSGDGGSADAAVSTLATVHRDQVYRNVDGPPLVGDVYVPAGSGPFAAVLVIHGGAFLAGAHDGVPESAWAAVLQGAGFVAFSVDYRLMGAPDGGAVFPGPLEDLKCATRWLKHHAALYRVDPGHVFAMGGSAGGHHAAMLGATSGEAGFDTRCGDAESESDAIAGAVDFFGPVDWDGLVDQRGSALQSGEAAYVGSTCESGPDRMGVCVLASVTSHLDASDPPFFLAHSDDDPTIPVHQSRDFQSRLTGLGISVEYREITGQGHGWHARFGVAAVGQTRDQVLAWLAAHR